MTSWAPLSGSVIFFLILVTGILSATFGFVGAEPTPSPSGLQVNTESGPDYSITGVVLPDQTSWIDTGTILVPNITVKNLGSDDNQTDAVQISAFLDSYSLIPENSTISPMKKGEERDVSPGFLIPGIIPTGEYALTISIDPNRDQAGGNIQNNDVSTTKHLNIRTVVPKVKVSSCGCS